MDEYHETRWGPPFPPWTRHQSKRAFVWLAVLLLITSLGICRGIDLNLNNPDTPAFPLIVDFDAIDACFPLVITSVQGKYPEARLIEVRFRAVKSWFGRILSYDISFNFCSPNDRNWNLSVSPVACTGWLRGMGMPVEPWREFQRYRDVCGLYSIEQPLINNVEAMAILQAFRGERLIGVEEWPASLSLNINDLGTQIWKG